MTKMMLLRKFAVVAEDVEDGVDTDCVAAAVCIVVV
jgi:hypothetical protein